VTGRAAGPPLLQRRLVFVTGKGGVGKSAVAAALALAGARGGKRTLLIEVAGQDRGSELFAAAGGRSDRERELAPNLVGITIDVERAIEEYLLGQLRVRPMVDLLVRSRAFHHFAAAAPGLGELVTVGKIWTLATALRAGERAPVWDLLVVDQPATGHAIAMLETAANVREIAGSGPIRDQAERIQQVVSHPAATGIALVARPEELAVTEAVEAAEALRARTLPVALAVMNGAADRRFSDEDERVLRAAARELRSAPAPHGGEGLLAAIEAAVAHRERQSDDAAHSERLAAGVGVPVLELPQLVRRRLDLGAIGVLADAIARSPESGA
jgi:anion-transporting  ArsA/GET3 family ATPase